MKKKILILTSSVFTDRILQYSDVLHHLKAIFNVTIWAKSVISNPEDWQIEGVQVESFKKTIPLRHWTSYVRRINEYAWTYYLPATSLKINHKYFVKSSLLLSLIKGLGYITALFRVSGLFEQFTRFIVRKTANNLEIMEQLKASSVDVVLVCNPFWVQEPLVAFEAKKLGIPVISMIPSWDNITTKSRISYCSDAFLVWSAVRIKELLKYYPESKNVPIEIMGTPQYDVFSDKRFLSTKVSFYEEYGLKEELPILLYTLGSPIFINSEIDVCLDFCLKAKQIGLLESYQILIRPHPIKDFREYIPQFLNVDSRIRIQVDVQTPADQKIRFQNKAMIKNWVSTFYYAEIVIATSSTTILDASMFNKRHINIAANLSGDTSLNDFLNDVSYGFEHLQTLNRLNLLNNVHSWTEFINQLQNYCIDQESIPNNSEAIVLHLAEFPNQGDYSSHFAKSLIKIINGLVQPS